MPVLIIAGAVLLFAVVFLPQVWVRHAMAKHGEDRPDFPGTGGELAVHLLELAGLKEVTVEETDQGDHYDPTAKAVRLSPSNLKGRSITAVAVAAHEVSHAVQHRDNHRTLLLRMRMAGPVQTIEMGAAALFATAPVIMAMAKSPPLLFLQIGVGFLLMGTRLAMHVVTLPVEFDASFNKALPVLVQGQYLSRADHKAAKTVLLAAALTYVAAALVTLLDLTRLIRIFR